MEPQTDLNALQQLIYFLYFVKCHLLTFHLANLNLRLSSCLSEFSLHQTFIKVEAFRTRASCFFYRYFIKIICSNGFPHLTSVIIYYKTVNGLLYLKRIKVRLLTVHMKVMAASLDMDSTFCTTCRGFQTWNLRLNNNTSTMKQGLWLAKKLGISRSPSQQKIDRSVKTLWREYGVVADS